jgi:hypothetical protein
MVYAGATFCHLCGKHPVPSALPRIQCKRFTFKHDWNHIKLLAAFHISKAFKTIEAAIIRNPVLASGICVADFLLWFRKNWPESLRVMKENPGFQEKFSERLG